MDLAGHRERRPITSALQSSNRAQFPQISANSIVLKLVLLGAGSHLPFPLSDATSGVT